MVKGAKSINILHVMQGTSLGGMEQVTLQRMMALSALGCPGRLVCLNSIGDLGPVLEKNRISATGLAYRGIWGWRSIPSMWQAFRSDSPEGVVMSGHNVAAMLALGNLCKGHRVLCIHYHRAGVKSRRHWRLIYNLAFAKFNQITFPSDFVRKEAEEICPAVRTISTTLRNPVQIPDLPDTEVRERARAVFGLGPGVPVIGNAGWLIPRKRWDVFLRVAQRVVGEIPEAVFLIAGDGPQRNELMRLAEELQIAGNVRWLGWQRELRGFYSAVDILLFNSDWDAMGHTAVEAMSYGVPVVASVVHGGLKELIDGDAVGYITEEHDLDWLADKALHLLTDPAVRRAIGARARERMACVCSPERDAAKIIGLLDLDEVE